MPRSPLLAVLLLLVAAPAATAAQAPNGDTSRVPIDPRTGEAGWRGTAVHPNGHPCVV